MFFLKRKERNINGHDIMDINRKKLPGHIAIIMDGNGRWASKRGLPRSMGHREGSSNLKRIVNFCSEIGIKYLTVYAFSTENWKRPKSEVDTLMSLLEEYLKTADTELKGKNVRIKVIGDVTRLPESIQKEIKRVADSTSSNTGLTLVIALNYGGRDEIINAVKMISRDVEQGVLKVEDINAELFSNRLYTSGIPDPDLLIRTSGEQRISNFFLWQSAYTEFWYTDVLWPDFSERDIVKAIKDYQKRSRRFGGV